MQLLFVEYRKESPSQLPILSVFDLRIAMELVNQVGTVNQATIVAKQIPSALGGDCPDFAVVGVYL